MNPLIAVITGGSEGLGRQIALQLIKDKVTVVLLARSENKLKETTEEINSLSGQAHYYVCDVSDRVAVGKVADQILNTFKGVDILINDAGVYFENASEKVTQSQVEQMFTINSLGTIYTTQAFLPHFKKQNQGQILNVISIAGLEPSSEWGIYAASKFAQTGFTESLRRELSGTKIKVMGFYPEGMDTQIFKKGGLDTQPGQPWMMKPEDAAKIVRFMLTQPADVSLSQVVVRKICM